MIKRGDRNVSFIGGEEVFKLADVFGLSHDECTVDSIHPTDLGFACMAKAFGDEIGKMMDWQ